MVNISIMLYIVRQVSQSDGGNIYFAHGKNVTVIYIPVMLRRKDEEEEEEE